MNTEGHEVGRMLNVDTRYILRNEYNGVTVYSREENMYRFYEGVFIEELMETINHGGRDAVQKHMAENAHRMTKNVQSDNPFFICWLISGSCNLDCIYCFAENKMPGRSVSSGHMDGSRDELETAETLLKLKPMCIGLTGGEPTLNPRLRDVLRFLRSKAATVLDTNGTTPQLRKLIPLLAESHTTVRLTVDILDDEILGLIRPRYHGPESSSPKCGKSVEPFSQVEILKMNIRAIVEAGIPLVIHSVLTRHNIGKLEKTAETLIGLGVKRWHFYTVNYSEKCKAFFDDIQVSRQEACDYTDMLREKYGRDLTIICPRNDIGFRERLTLMVDCHGRFLVDTVYHGSAFIGVDPCHPKKEEILSMMNFEGHKEGYLSNFW